MSNKKITAILTEDCEIINLYQPNLFVGENISTDIRIKNNYSTNNVYSYVLDISKPKEDEYIKILNYDSKTNELYCTLTSNDLTQNGQYKLQLLCTREDGFIQKTGYFYLKVNSSINASQSIAESVISPILDAISTQTQAINDSKNSKIGYTEVDESKSTLYMYNDSSKSNLISSISLPNNTTYSFSVDGNVITVIDSNGKKTILSIDTSDKEESDKIGQLINLSTSDKSSVVNAINELKTYSNSIKNDTSANISNLQESLDAATAELDNKASVSDLNAAISQAGANGLKYENDILYLTKDDVIIGNGIEITNGNGSGGAGNNAILTVTNNTGWISSTISDTSTCKILFNWSSTEDSSPTGNGTAVLKVNGVQKMTRDIAQGDVSLSIRSYLQSGTNSVKLTISDVYGNSRTINFTITVLSYILTSTFDDTQIFSGMIPFVYIATGSGTKTMHFIVDGEEVSTTTVLTSGRQNTQNIAKLAHGSHSIETYFSVQYDNQLLESNRLIYNIICTEENNSTPIISLSYNDASAEQYSNIVIPYMVYTPTTSYSDIKINVNGVTINNLKDVDRTKHTFSYKASKIGKLVIQFISGVTTVTKEITVSASDIQINAVTEDLELYLTAEGRSNNESAPATWSNNGIDVTMSGFNFTSNGWMLDDENNSILHIDGEARITIPFKLFENDIRTTGKTIEIEFTTKAVRDYETTLLSCLSGGRGLYLTPQKIKFTSEQSSIETMYKEDEHVRISFVIEKKSENRLILCYINGVISAVVQYPEDDDFTQSDASDITIGSSDCAIDIYCIRVYGNSLNRYQIKDNWIADTQDVTDMMQRYERNNLFDEYDNIVIDKLPNDLPYMIITGSSLPTYKGDKKTVMIQFVDPSGEHTDFSAENVQIDVQGTSSAGYARKNFKCKFKSGFVLSDGAIAKYQMTSDSIATDTFTFKADVASSEGCNNVELVRLYNEKCVYKTIPQQNNSMVRQGIDGFPMVIFHNDGNKTSFIGKYNFNNDKSTEDVFGFKSGDESWEVLNNTSDRILFKSADFTGEDWLNDFEGRYPDGNTVGTNLAEFVSWINSTDQEAATNNLLEEEVTYDDVTYTNDTAEYRLAKFKAEAAEHMSVEDACFYYLFTEIFLMVDSRGKNMFPSFYLDSDNNIKWVFLPYDMDTAIGINNEGALAFDYSLEDIDQTDSGADVYNAQNSVLWINVRQAFRDKIASIYSTIRSNGMSYADTEERFETHQAKWPEAIFNEDAYYKYLEPLITDGNATYLSMCQGSKAEQRKWWLYNRFKYMDSKYIAGDSTSDIITLRGYAKSNISVIPYADIYATIKYGSYTVQTRAERNKTYTLQCPLDNVNDTEIYIYNCSQLKSIGDISGLMVGYADFTKAVKLIELKIGDSASSYSNTNLKELYLGNNTLLKKIDVRNSPSLAQSVDLSGCTNIEEVYFDGTAVAKVSVPNGGSLRIFHLPNTITNFTLQNQKNITDLQIDGYDNLTTLVVENCADSVDPISIVENMPASSRVRIIGFTYSVSTVDEIYDLYDKLDTMRGLDENGNNTIQAKLTGTIYIDSILGSDYNTLTSRYSDVKIVYNTITSTVTFYNFDNTVLDTKTSVNGAMVVYGGATPTRATDIQYKYTFANGWSYSPDGEAVANILKNNIGDKNVYAVYNKEIRSYTITFVNGTSGTNRTLQTISVNYGELPVYSGEALVYEGSDAQFWGDFTEWTPTLSLVTGNATYYAQFKDNRLTTDLLIMKTLTEYRDDEITHIVALRGKSDGSYAAYSGGSLTSIYTPNVVTIEAFCCDYMTCIKSFYAPKLTAIPRYAFEATSLSEVNFPLVTEVNTNCFGGNKLITELTFPSLQSLNGNMGTGNLEYFDMGQVSTIAAGSLGRMINLKTIILRNTAKVCTYNSTQLSADPQNTDLKIYVPQDLLEDYKVATNWSRLADHFVALEGSEYE